MVLSDDFKCPYCGCTQDSEEIVDCLQDEGIHTSSYVDISCDECGKTYNIHLLVDYEPMYIIKDITKYENKKERLKGIKK